MININFSHYFGRSVSIFKADIDKHDSEICEIVSSSSFLVLGAAGSVGQAVVKEIFRRNPVKLHLVDINENNMTELVRDIRSSMGYVKGDFRTFILDIGSLEFDYFLNESSGYDYVLNLSALKHVRSEKDKYTLMRMVKTNILNTKKTVLQSIKINAKKYFSVSTDKATAPVNLMGASKRVMELFLNYYSNKINISSARFANVAFSDGSLLDGFKYRFIKRQPIVAPHDIKRYFISSEESGQLCLLSCLLGENKDIFFPKLDSIDLIPIHEIAEKYIFEMGFKPKICKSEDEARSLMGSSFRKGMWPLLQTISDTTGEKPFEEFYGVKDNLDMNYFNNIGIIKNRLDDYDFDKLERFESQIKHMLKQKKWTKEEIINEFSLIIPELNYKDIGKYLDDKM